MQSLFSCFKRIDGGFIILGDVDSGDFNVIFSRSKNGEEARVDFSRTVVNRVIREGKAVMVSDTSLEDEWDASSSIVTKDIKSVMCVPLINQSRIRGVIYVHSVDVPHGFRKDDLFLLTAISTPAAVAFENAHLYSEQKRAEEALRVAHDELEKRVVERTAELSRTNTRLREEITERKRIEDELRKKTEDLNIRIKGLFCLYAISRLQSNADMSLDDMLQGIVNQIPGSMQYPESASARIVLEKREYRTPNFEKTDWELSSSLVIKNNWVGNIQIFYGDEKPEADEGPFLREERTLLNVIAERVIETIERKQAEDSLALARKREVEIGAKIQQTLLLGRLPRDIAGMRAACLSIPSQRIDGDFYDFFKHSGSCVDLVVGDVMGKGVPAALLGAGTKSHFLRVINQLLSTCGQLPEPHDIVQTVHDQMVRELIELEAFITICYARFELDRGRMEIVDCGHPKPIHFHKKTQRCTQIEGRNVPLGFNEEEKYESVRVRVEPGDALFFFSDGITDVRNERGEIFGPERLTETVQANIHLDLNRIIDQIRKAVVAHGNTEIFTDDFTCVAVKIGSDREAPMLVYREVELSSKLKELGRARAFIHEILDEPELSDTDEKVRWRLELAVNETAANIMKHAYRGREDQTIHIRAEVYPGEIVVRLDHWGEAFEPPSVEPTLDFTKEHGFGLFIMDKCVDEILYMQHESGKNSVCLSIKRSDHVGEYAGPVDGG
jgi:sigma-B regulation protein RsbU (phosphoserine phosphatase)